MGLRPTEGHDDTVWKNQLAGESARVGQAFACQPASSAGAFGSGDARLGSG